VSDIATYYKKFIKLNNLNLFGNVHKIIIKIFSSKNLINTKDLFIDSKIILKSIKNINGIYWS